MESMLLFAAVAMGTMSMLCMFVAVVAALNVYEDYADECINKTCSLIR